MGTAFEGSQSFDSAGSKNVLVVGGGDGGAEERTHPEDPLHQKEKIQRKTNDSVISSSGITSLTNLCAHLIVPDLLLVEDDCRAEASRRVDSRTGDGDGRQVHHEYGEPYRQRRQNLAPVHHH